MRRTLGRLVAAAIGAAILVAPLAGCGGGADDAAVPPAAPSAGMPLPSGVGAEQSAALAVAALGTPAAVHPADQARGLAGYDAVGGVRDAFVPLVPAGTEDAGSADGAGPSAPPASAVPALTVPQATLPPPPASAPVPPSTTGPSPGTTAPEGPAGDGEGEGPTSTWRPQDTPIASPPDADAGRVALTADIEVDGETLAARRGDAVPPTTQRFTVVGVAHGSVVLRLMGALLPDGTDLLTLALGEEVTLRDAVTGRTERITLIGIRAG